MSGLLLTARAARLSMCGHRQQLHQQPSTHECKVSAHILGGSSGALASGAGTALAAAASASRRALSLSSRSCLSLLQRKQFIAKMGGQHKCDEAMMSVDPAILANVHVTSYYVLNSGRLSSCCS